jgi:2-dehydropantoate 2-reductase
MKVCIFGTGAVGSHVAARLSAAKQGEISVVARGAQLEAIRRSGLTLKSGGKEIQGTPSAATDDPATLPPQDVLITTLKAHALPPLAQTFERMLAPGGSIVFMLNGITWWWNEGRKGGALPLLDPEHQLWERLRKQALGCVIYSPNELEAPGIVVHVGGNKFVIGEPSGENSERLKKVVDFFNASGLTSESREDLRGEIFRKLVANASGSSLAALTRLGLYDQGQNPDLVDYSVRIITETLEVAAALGWDVRKEIDARAIATRGVPGGPRVSMLQDVLLGRRIEVEALVGQTQAFAREAGVPVPTLDAIVPLLRGLDQSLRAAQSRGA